MALDRALLEGVQAGAAPALRLYRWNSATLSLGRNQPVRGRLDRDAAAARGIDVVRRPTGGRAVLHDRELTYAVAVPIGALGGPRASYRAVNRALVAGLRRLGVRAELAGETASSASAALDGVCFDGPASGEVVVDGRKLVGSAQRCERRTLLQHGSILIAGDQRAVASLLGGEPEPPIATLDALLGRDPDIGELAGAICAGFEDALGLRLHDAPEPSPDPDRVARLHERFGSEAWTWRR
ncbi:MAG: lipoate--protein ligase family protein [Gemmatimonadota bacterium]